MLARFAALARGEAPDTTPDPNGLLKATEEDFSGCMGYLLLQLRATARLKVLLVQADTQWSATKLLVSCLASSLLGALFAHIVLPLGPVAWLLGACAGYLPVFVLKTRRKRRIIKFEKSLPEVVDTLSRSLRAGHSLTAAISIVAENSPEPARSEFAEVFRKQNFGLPLRDALMELLGRIPSQDLRVLVTGILVQKDTGGNITTILDRTSAVIRERLKLQGDIRVHTAQGRLTGWILCLLPFIMFVTLNLMNPGYSKVLTDTPLGRKLLYAGMGLLGLGVFLIRRIVTSIEV